jgi:hypothetical protein
MNYIEKLKKIIEAGGTRAITPKNTVLVTVTCKGEVVVGDHQQAAACRWVSEDIAPKLATVNS